MAKGDSVGTVIEWIVIGYLILIFGPRLLAMFGSAFGQPYILTPQQSANLQYSKILNAAGTGTAGIVGDLFNSVDGQIG